MSPTGHFLSLAKKGHSAPRRGSLSFVSDGSLLPIAAKVTKNAIQGGRKFRSPFPLENPPSLNDQKGGVATPPLWKPHPVVCAIIKSRLCRKAAKVGGGRGPPFERRPCHETKNHTALHCRAKAAALQEAETVQHLGEIFAAQRSRGKSIRDKNHVKARKEIQKRSFWRRFWVLLPLMAKVPRRRQKGDHQK